MKTKIITFLLTMCSLMTFAQHHHAGNEQKTEQNVVVFKDAKLGEVYNHYLHVKDALVASNSEEARKSAGELQKALKPLKGAGDAHATVAKLVAAKDLGEQRELFSTVSNEMTALVKGGKLTSGSLYLEYCPMANNNEGAFWLSNEKQIKNPYFGDMMLKCGSVKETIQ